MQFTIKCLATVALFFIGSITQSKAIDICVLEPLTVTEIRGQVVAARSENRPEEPIAGSSVELSKISDRYGWRIIARATTDSKGCFTLTGIKPGTYSLAAKHPNLFTTEVEVRVTKRTKKDAAKKQLILALGYSMPGCHGGYAELRQRKHE